MAQLIFKVLQCNCTRFFSIFVCQHMLKNEISSHKILSTISLNTFSGSFSRYCNGFFQDLNAI